MAGSEEQSADFPCLLFTVDITVYCNGYHGDLNETFYVGEVDEGARRLVQTTYECLMQAIDAGKACLKQECFGSQTCLLILPLLRVTCGAAHRSTGVLSPADDGCCVMQ